MTVNANDNNNNGPSSSCSGLALEPPIYALMRHLWGVSFSATALDIDSPSNGLDFSQTDEERFKTRLIVQAVKAALKHFYDGYTDPYFLYQKDIKAFLTYVRFHYKLALKDALNAHPSLREKYNIRLDKKALHNEALEYLAAFLQVEEEARILFIQLYSYNDSPPSTKKQFFEAGSIFNSVFAAVASALLASLCIIASGFASQITPGLIILAVFGGLVNLGLNLFIMFAARLTREEISIINDRSKKEMFWFIVSLINSFLTVLERAQKKLTGGATFLKDWLPQWGILAITINVAIESVYFYVTSLYSDLEKRFPKQMQTLRSTFKNIYHWFYPNRILRDAVIKNVCFSLGEHANPRFLQNDSSLNKSSTDTLMELLNSASGLSNQHRSALLSQPKKWHPPFYATVLETVISNNKNTSDKLENSPEIVMLFHSLINQEFERVVYLLKLQAGTAEAFKRYNLLYVYQQVQKTVFERYKEQFQSDNVWQAVKNAQDDFVQINRSRTLELLSNKLTQWKAKGYIRCHADLQKCFDELTDDLIEHYNEEEHYLNSYLRLSFPNEGEVQYYRRMRRPQLRNMLVDMYNTHFLSDDEEGTLALREQLEQTYKADIMTPQVFFKQLRRRIYLSIYSCTLGALLPAIASVFLLNPLVGIGAALGLSIFGYLCSLVVGFFFIYRKNYTSLAAKMDEKREPFRLVKTAPFVAFCVLVFAIGDTNAKAGTAKGVSESIQGMPEVAPLIFMLIVIIGSLGKTYSWIFKEIQKLFGKKNDDRKAKLSKRQTDSTKKLFEIFLKPKSGDDSDSNNFLREENDRPFSRTSSCQGLASSDNKTRLFNKTKAEKPEQSVCDLKTPTMSMSDV